MSAPLQLPMSTREQTEAEIRVRPDGLLQHAVFWVVLQEGTGDGAGCGHPATGSGAAMAPIAREVTAETMNAAFILMVVVVVGGG